MDCIYRGAPRGKTSTGGLDVLDCQLHGKCTIESNTNRLASCVGCKEHLAITDKGFASRWIDPLTVYDRHAHESDSIRNMLAGRSVFLACGGPSAKELPLGNLQDRGAWTLAVNNSGGYYRANAFVCSDPPSKFSHCIWRDPSIMKFIPRPKLGGRRGRLRVKRPEHAFETCGECGGQGFTIEDDEEKACGRCCKSGAIKFDPMKDSKGHRLSVNHMPNVWAFKRRSWLQCDDTFFTDDHASWGNQDAGVLRTGERKTASTMLLGMRLLRYLGARRVYLLGVDFGMNPMADERDNYAFPESRDAGAIASNNSQFAIANDWLCRLQTARVFERFGIDFYNCNERSGLRAFPFIPFVDACHDVTRGVDGNPDLADWYEK